MPIEEEFIAEGVAPQLESAEALSSTRIRLVFSEPMLSDSELDDPSNYTLVADGGSTSRTVTAVDVGLVPFPTSVILTLSGPMTPGVDNYNVTVSNVTDVAENVIDGAADSLDVSGPGASAVYTVSAIGSPVPLQLLGALAGDYRVHVGETGDDTDPQVYNGIPGSGGEVVAFTYSGGVGTALVYFPPTDPGTYTITLVPVNGDPDIVYADSVEVLPPEYKSRTLSLRSVLPPWYKVGRRRI